MSAPALLAVSHGTSDPVGQAAVVALVRAVAAARPGTPVHGGFVDVRQLDVPTALDSLDLGAPVVIVPLLPSAGYHVHVDLADAAREAVPRQVTVTGALGPDHRVTGILAERLRQIGFADPLRDDDGQVPTDGAELPGASGHRSPHGGSATTLRRGWRCPGKIAGWRSVGTLES